MKRIIFWGGTGQAIVLEEMLMANDYELLAVVDNNSAVSTPFKDIPMLYGKQQFEDWYKQNGDALHFAVAIGGNKGSARIEIAAYLESLGLHAASLFHPTCFCAANAIIGKGAQVSAHGVICARSKVGDQVIVNTSASIDHECKIGNGVHIGPGAKLAGCVTIKENAFIGTGAIVLPRVTIGANTVVGAGGVVTKDLPDNVVAYGNPAKIVNKIP